LRSWIEAYQRTRAARPQDGEPRLLRRRYILFLFAAVFVLVGFAILLWRDWVVFEATSAHVVQLRQSVLLEDRFAALVVSAETGERGYLLTRDARYLEPYLDAVADYPKVVDALRATPTTLLAPDELRRLVSLSDDKMARLRKGVELARAGQRDLAISLVQSDQGPGRMGEFRSLASRIRDRQFQALVAANAQSRRWLTDAAALQLIGALALVILLLLALIDLARVNRFRSRTLAEVTRVNEELIQVSSVASHDLKEPLRTIVNFSQLLERRFSGKVLDQTAADYLDVIRTSAMRSYQLIDALQRFSTPLRSDPGCEPLADADAALRNVLQSLRTKIFETGTDVAVDAMAATVRLESHFLEQIFQNLLENAMKYRRPDKPPRIDVHARLEATRWLFWVSDNGIGFDPAFAERVFGLFQRLHEDEYSGVGLGLATCKKIVESAGGRIWAESTPGAGSSFFFTLPAAQRAEKRASTVAAEIHGGRTAAEGSYGQPG